MKETKWRIELNEHQLRLIANCVEDCCRFIGGQMELSNSTACLKHYRELVKFLAKFLIMFEASSGITQLHLTADESVAVLHAVGNQS